MRRKGAFRYSREAEREKATKDFIEKVLFILSAKLAELLYAKIILLMVYGDEGNFSAAQQITMKTIHVAIIVAVCPAVGYILSGRVVSGTSLWKDALKLIAGSCAMIVSWGFRELVHDFCIYVGNKFWQKMVMAVVFTIVVVIAEVMPCYKRSKAAVATGGLDDSLWARYIIIPGHFGLAIGSLWNSCATHGVHYMQNRTEKHLYWVSWQLLSTFIIGVAATVSNEVLSRKMASVIAAQQGEQEQLRREESMHALATDIDVHWMQTAITSISFLYGWAIIDALDDMYFAICLGCKSAVVCSFQSNLAFAMGTTYIFCKVVCILTHVIKSMDDNDQIATSLQMKGLTLTVGWAWVNFAVTFDQYAINLAGMDTLLDQIQMNSILCLGALAISITIYHITWRAVRESGKQREAFTIDTTGEVGHAACQTIIIKATI